MKAKDTQRKEDFDQIHLALDTYYNDFNCYPQTLSFGEEWEVNDVIYMKKIPQDPNCGSGEACYAYTVDPGQVCPQWHVLFGKLRLAPPVSTPACLLQDECLPINYEEYGYNFCEFGGNIDCSSLQSISLPEIEVEDPLPSTPTPTEDPEISPPSSDPTPVPPTPTFTIPQDGIYYCGCGNNHVTVCNVTFTIPQGIPYYLDSACSNQCGQSC